jgi:hypothetical protein
VKKYFSIRYGKPLTNSVYLPRDQAEIDQERLLGQINHIGLNHASWLQVRGMTPSIRHMKQIMTHIALLWAINVHMLAIAGGTQEARSE